MSNENTRKIHAGFWRRVGALLVDWLVVFVPLQIVVAALFSFSHGAIQAAGGIHMTVCTEVELNQLPQGLDPPPPTGANSASECTTSFFGLVSARTLSVARVTKTGNTTRKVWQVYALDTDGKPRHATSVDWVVYIVLLIYLVTLEHRFGATLGKHLVGLRVFDVATAASRGVALHRAIARNLLMWAGLVPLLVVGGAFLIAYSGDYEAIPFEGFLYTMVGAGLLTLAWYIWILISIARKDDPIYDRLAWTSVILRPNTNMT